MSTQHGQSQLWEHINNTWFSDDSNTDLRNFKSNGINFKLALWNTQVNGVRYLKTLTYHLAAGLSERSWAQLRRVKNRDIGGPISVTRDGESICLDYIRAVHEIQFIGDRMPLDGATVMEIGAGYGRTCHAMISNHDLAAYYIVDLPHSLKLAETYLGTVLTEQQFRRIRFVPVAELEEHLAGVTFDLCFNIDSFHEMPEETVRNYLSLVDRQCRHLYTNNPVGKYLDPSLDGHSEGQDVVAMALSAGLLRDIVDIDDNRAVADESAKFVAAYRPGDRWTVVADEWATPWGHFWQALYRKQDDAA